MKRVAVSQRVDILASRGERRDALDQRWSSFLAACGLVPILIPNLQEVPTLVEEIDIRGVILTGGNDLADLGGDAPERDRTENSLIDWAVAKRIPVIGVCRGMQLIQHRFGAALGPVENHVARSHAISGNGRSIERTCYHRIGTTKCPDALEVIARAEDGVVEHIRHRTLPLLGLMWHPERAPAPDPDDVALFRSALAG